MNDLSVAGQFQSIHSFHDAVGQLMKIRQEIQRLGSSLYCHRKLAQAQVTAESGMQQAIQGLPLSQRRAWIQWLTKQGPYWEDARLHNAEDWLEVKGTIVTDTAVGEAAICHSRGLWRELVSFAPSDWIFTPVDVIWVHDDTVKENVSIPNHWDIASVQASLAANPPQIDSWGALAAQMMRECTRLTFGETAFQPLQGQPFVLAAAKRIQVLLRTLDKFKGCFDEKKQRTPEGHRIYTDYFTGDNALFSDSSDAEKNDFMKDLTFPHPGKPNETLFCTWHGKVNTPKFRIHFSSPISADIPLYVVYVGPKITKR